MKRNRVQFQKGLSLGKFLQRYGSEGPCEQAVFKARWPDGFRCPECGSRRHCRIRSRKLWQCHACHRRTSLVAGTIFAATQLPLTVRCLALHLLTQGQHGVASLELARQPGVSRNTAWKMKHKLLQVMKERDERVPPGGIVQVDDAYRGGERSGGKRGRGAAGKTPFVAAVQVTAAGQPARMRLSSGAGLRKKTLAAWAGRHLQPGTEVHSDGPACFRGVAGAGCEHVPTVTGGGQRSCADSRFVRVNTMLGNVKQSLAGTCHAFDGKHLPRYLAEFRYRFNRRYDLEALVPRLLHASVRTPPMPHRLLTLAESCG